jgi:hypothetical protein
LEDDAARNIRSSNVLSVDENLAFHRARCIAARAQEAGGGAQERGLAATAWSDQAHELTWLDPKRDAGHGIERVEPNGYVSELDAMPGSATRSTDGL